MAIRPTLKDLSWIAGGTIPLIVVTLLAFHYHREEDAATRTALKAQRIEFVVRMRAALASASEFEKSAVMATTDQESETLAQQSRAASAMVEQARDGLGALLKTDGTREERDLLDQFSQALGECQHIDRELLELAVKNTNLKAYSLAFGPAADALAGADSALSRILSAGASSTDADARNVVLLAADANRRAWRILTLLPPHISEESDQRMDELEVRIANEDREIRTDLKALAVLLGAGNPDIERATSRYDRFAELKIRILDLSRQNTNVRSLIISLNQKRKAVQICQDALAALEQAIQGEPVTDRVPVSPR